MFSCSKGLLIYFVMCGFLNSFYAASAALMPVLQKQEVNENLSLPGSAGLSDSSLNSVSRNAHAELVEKFDNLIIQFNNSKTLREFHELNQQIEEMAFQLGGKFISNVAKGTKQIYHDYWRKIENPPAK